MMAIKKLTSHFFPYFCQAETLKCRLFALTLWESRVELAAHLCFLSHFLLIGCCESPGRGPRLPELRTYAALRFTGSYCY